MMPYNTKTSAIDEAQEGPYNAGTFHEANGGTVMQNGMTILTVNVTGLLTADARRVLLTVMDALSEEFDGNDDDQEGAQ